MKQARQVELKAGQTLDQVDYKELADHARNSAIWYATNYSKTKKEMMEKLYKKGYPREDVFVLRNGVKETVNIVSDTMAFLEGALYIDDERYAESFAESRKRRGFGRSRVSTELYFKGIEQDMLERVLDQVYEAADEELEAFLRKQHGLLGKREADHWKLKRKLMQKAASRGWSMDMIGGILDEIMEEPD